MVGGCQGSGGSWWAVELGRRVGHWGIQTEEIRGSEFTAEDGGENRSRPERVCYCRKCLWRETRGPPHSRLAEEWCKDGKISSHTRHLRALSSERVDIYFSQVVPPLLSLSKIGTQQLPCAGETKTLKFVCCSQIWEIRISKMAYNFELNNKWFVQGESCAYSLWTLWCNAEQFIKI